MNDGLGTPSLGKKLLQTLFPGLMDFKSWPGSLNQVWIFARLI